MRGKGGAAGRAAKRQGGGWRKAGAAARWIRVLGGGAVGQQGSMRGDGGSAGDRMIDRIEGAKRWWNLSLPPALRVEARPDLAVGQRIVMYLYVLAAPHRCNNM